MSTGRTEATRIYSLFAAPTVAVCLVVTLLVVGTVRAAAPFCCMDTVADAEVAEASCCCPEAPLSVSHLISGHTQNHSGVKECCVIWEMNSDANKPLERSAGIDISHIGPALAEASQYDLEIRHGCETTSRGTVGRGSSIRLHVAHQVFLC